MKQKKLTKKEEEKELRDNPINVFDCCGKAFPHRDFMEHLKTEHGLETSRVEGKRSMIMHMDGDYWFSSQYEWELESGLKFGQFVKMARSGDDMMRHG